MKNFHSFSKFSSFSIQFKILENKGLFIKKNHFSIFFCNSHSYRLDFLVYSLEFIIYLIIAIFCPSEENIVFEPFFRANKYRGGWSLVQISTSYIYSHGFSREDSHFG